MKLFVMLLSVALSTTATPFALELAALPDDGFEAALGGLDMALSTSAVSSETAAMTRASLRLADESTPGETVRAAAQIAFDQDAARGVDASATLAAAKQSAAVLDLVDAWPRESVVDVLGFAAEVSRIQTGSPGLDARTPLAFTNPGDALEALVLAAGHAWTPTTGEHAATLNALPEPTRTGVLIMLDTHIAARAHLEGYASAGMQENARAFIAERLGMALPSLVAVQTSHADFVQCGTYNLRLSDEDSLHTCGEASLITLDLGGDDTYHALGGVVPTGCSFFTVPVRVDVDEPSVSTSEPCTPFPERNPFVIFVDVAGDDTYTSVGTTITYGYVLGATGEYGAAFSTFFDLAGNDFYSITERQWGARGMGAGGLFFDAGGDDIHVTQVSSFVNWDLGSAQGIFIDAKGDDHYTLATSLYCAGNMGYTLDLEGADVWSVGCQGFGVGRSGLFVDAGGGTDRYHKFLFHDFGGTYASFAGCDLGVCVFRDDGGDNAFLAEGRVRSITMGAAGGYPLQDVLANKGQAVGIMLVGEGDDSYEVAYAGLPTGTSTFRVAMGASITGVGILLDEGGANTYIVGAADYAQGASRGGVGVFVDRGSDATISLEAGVGQGTGLRGIGLVIRTRGDALTTYSAGTDALTSLTSGGGVGMRIHRGPVDLLGRLPDFTCAPDATTIAGAGGVTVLDRRVVEAYLCAPDGDSGDQLVNPVTDEDVDDLSRPAVDCTSGPLGDLGCEQTVSEAWGPGAVDWLDDDTFTMRTSGGFSWLSASGKLSTMFELQSVDNACKISCATWDNADRIG